MLSYLAFRRFSTQRKRTIEDSHEANKLKMTLTPFIIFCAFIAFSAAALNPIRGHPHSVVVTDGSWANFSCGIKFSDNAPGSIKWRIGDFRHDGKEYYSADRLPALEGVTAERSFTPDITGHILTETIGILATEEMDGTPVECMFNHPAISTRNSYSKFALLNVHNHGC